MLKKNIVLIGMMAAGKTTIGYKLAKALKYDFFDIDSEIEKSENEKIVNIFQDKGEEYFRKIEEKVCIDLLKVEDCIISFGGGSITNSKIRQMIKKNSFSIYL